MEGLFDNLEGRPDSLNFEPLTSTLRFFPCTALKHAFVPCIKEKKKFSVHNSEFRYIRNNF